MKQNDRTDQIQVRVIYMASGQSRRFGSINKLLLNLDGKPLFAHVLDRLAQLVNRYDWLHVVVVTSFSDILNWTQRLGLYAVHNTQPERGQSESIRLGLAAQAEDYQIAVFMTADQPDLSETMLIQFLEQARLESESMVCATDGERWGNPVSFPQMLIPDLLALRGDVGGKAVMRLGKVPVRPCYVSSEALWDIDCPSDLTRRIK